MNKLLLLDGNSMLFRAYYGTLARGHMMSESGVVTNAVYGFSTMLNKALEIIEPSHILVAFDTKDKTFRHEMYEDYKGTRPVVDPELVSQFELVREFLDAYPIKRFELSGYEADDIIGTLSKQYPDMEIDILTSDRDMLQLISDNVNVVLMKKGLTNLEVMDTEKLMTDFEIRPDQVVDMKALMGDASDNIPGVPSIGEKTALKLIKKYDTFENVYAHVDEIKGKMGEKLIEFKDQAYLSYDLAKINCEVPVDLSLEEIELIQASETLNAFYRKYDMNSLVREDVSVTKDEKEKLHKVDITDFTEKDPVYAILDMNKKEVIEGIYLAQKEHVSYLSVKDMKTSVKFSELVAQNDFILLQSKPFYKFVLSEEMAMKSQFEDVLLLAFIVDASITTVARLQDEHDFWFHEYEESEKGYALAYNLQILYEKLYQQAEKDAVLSVYQEIEKPLVSVLAKCELEGICVDPQVLDDIAEKTMAKIEALETEIYAYVKEPFNLNSPKQLSEVLFDELELPQIKKRSTAVGVLEALEDKHPIIAPVLEYRKYQKLYSTYAHGLSKYISDDHKIHTSFNQHATQTGRLSSSDPNLQNISVRDEETRQIRRAFVASKDSYLVSIDYSQIELRVLAYLAHEEKMIEAFKNDEDIHQRTAREIFHKEDVDQADRRHAKSVNFGIVYGMSPYGLSKQLEIPMKQAAEFIDRYNQAYPNIESYMQTLIDDCKASGYVETVFHRRRYIPEIHSSNRGTAQFGERAAMNAPIQGTAADIIKMAMIKVDRLLSEKEMKSKMILQVHDELVFDVPFDELEVLIDLVQHEMETIVDWPVPLKVSVSVGKNWMEDINA